MTVVGVQLDIAWEDKEENFRRVRSLMADAPSPAGSLVVLPEMFATGFSMNSAEIAEEAGGPTEGFLSALSAEYRCWVLGGLVSRHGDRGLNDALLFGPEGGPLARYSKRHPFSYAGETDHYAAGDDLVLAEVDGFSLCPLVCYDLRFPEDFRTGVRRGATLFIVVANWPASRERHWRVLLEARAVENQAYVVGVNRCGADPNVAYAGGSVVFDPRGGLVAEAADQACLLTAELDPGLLADYRAGFPALRDMRDD